ncbi:alpha/beta hydrolase, partial [Streptomyces sp. NPDC058371]
GAGHNISLGQAARSYHLRALAFFEECLQSAQDDSATVRSPGARGAFAA